MADTDILRRRLAEATADDFEILEELGRGGMATVYRARELSLGRQVAIKVMSPQLLAVDGMAERFLLEARIAAALSHPHIIPIHAVRRSGDLLYFVMKYVAGRSLDRIVAEHGPLDLSLVRAILTQVGAALEAAHHHGIIHRDIKPANILLDEHGNAVVADFGIARIAERPGVTQEGKTLGTPAYMSPEQFAGEAVTPASDQYALGIVAYELLTGAPPFTGESLMQVVWRMVNEPVVPLGERRVECRGPVAAAVHRMLAKRPDARWPSVADAIAALPPLPLGPRDPVRHALVALATGRPIGAATPADAEASTHLIPTPPRSGTPVRSVTPVRGTTPARGTPETMQVQRLSPPAVDTRRLSPPMVEARRLSPPTVPATIERSIVTPADLPVLAPDPDDPVPAALPSGALRLQATAGTLTIDDTVRLVAEWSDTADAWHAATDVTWHSSDGAVATVSPGGALTATGIGRATITARHAGMRATLELTVTRATLGHVAVTPRPSRVEVGDRVALRMSTVERTPMPAPRLVSWASSAPEVVRVSARGELLARSEGAAELIVRAGGTEARIPVRVVRATVSAVQLTAPRDVLRVGETVPLAAQVLNGNGHPLHHVPVRFEVSDATVAAVTRDGVLQAKRPGRVLIAAKAEGRVGTVRVTIAASSLAAAG